MEAEKNERDLKRILELHDPILLVGAGFALGAKTNQNQSFPSGKSLKEKIIQDLLKYPKDSNEFNELNNLNLSDVCDFCESELSTAHLTDYLVQTFKNARPATYQKLICDYHWKKIYTTNIDDIVETCYSEKNKEIVVQNLRRKNTSDIKDRTEYIKLHGCVNNPSEGLTFSSKGYLDTMLLQKDYRFNSLSLDMHSETIIFLGHDFNEINIDFYLKLYQNSGYQSSKGKLIFVNPFPSLLFKSKIKAMGAQLIEWDAEKFLHFITKIKEQSNPSPLGNQLKILGRYGFSNLHNIKSNILPISKYESDLYFGYEPKWEDIFDEWDFQNRIINDEVFHFINGLKNSESAIISLYGKGLIGKSTFLMRIGQLLESRHFETWIFTGKYFNYYEFFKWTKLNREQKYFALLIDDAAHRYRDISRLINLMSGDQQLIVITAARLPLHLRLRYSFIDIPHKEHYIEPKINPDFAFEVEKTLNKKGYLGTIKALNHEERIKRIGRSNDVLNILYEITYGKGFRDRLNKNLIPLLKSRSDGKDLLIELALFERLDLPFIPKELLSLQFGSELRQTISQIDDFVKYTANGDLSLRTGYYLTTIFKSADKNRILEILKTVLINIAPQLDDKPSNMWNHLEAACINERLLRQNLNLSTIQIRDMLYQLKDELGGSYNYWIQLGIAEQKSKSFDKALNHFRQAEVINPGSYMVQNAIGRNYLKHANSMKEKSIALKMFEDGEEILLNLIRKREEHQVRAFSTHAYIYEKISFLRKFNIIPPNGEIRELFNLVKKLIDKDPNDIMAKHISNYFLDFLKSVNRTGVIKMNYHDLGILQSMLHESDIKIEDLIEY